MPQRRITDAFQRKKRTTDEPKKDGPSKKAKIEPEDVEKAEAERKRQEELDYLRKFDLNHEYGPCNGITRVERWERAKRHGLNPSQRLVDLVKGNPNNTRYTECVWFTYHL